MIDIEKELKILFQELHFHEELKKLKSVSVIFFCGSKGQFLSKEFKDKLVDLIKEGKITVFEGVYDKFNSPAKDIVDSHLENDTLFPFVGIGLPY